MGSWELLEESSEVAAVHAALLPDGEVVYYSGNTGPEIPADTRIWNPVQRLVRPAPNAPDTDLFCNGLTLLWDGRLFVAGGTAKYSEGPGDPWFGSNAAYRFDPFAGWERIEDMAFGRWYPSAIALPDGRDYEVTIPPGVRDGQLIRLAGEGGSGIGGGPRGDFLLRVRVRPDRRFRVDGRDLHTDLRVAPWEAALGASVEVQTLTGKSKVRVPAGSSCGRRLRLRGQGLPNPRGEPGDLYAAVQIRVPRNLTADERELFERLAETSGFDPRKGR